MFSEGREDDEERAGRPNTLTTDENIDEVKKIVLPNRQITIREIAEQLSKPIGLCHFTNDLGMSRVQSLYQNYSISTKNSDALTLLRCYWT